jgi:hypothetical protein
MDIGKAFSFMFDDEDWIQKIVIGALLVLASAIPVVNIFTGLVVLGYAIRTLQNVARGEARPLPEWDDWGGDWLRGLFVALASLIYSLPVILASGLSSLLGAAADPYRYGNGPSGVVGVFVGLLACFSVIWGLLESIVLPAATIRYAADEEFGSFFKFGDIFEIISNHLGDYIIAWLLTIVAGIIAGLGVILCIIGVFLTTFWSYLVTAHLFGQVARETRYFTFAPAGAPPAGTPPAGTPPTETTGPITTTPEETTPPERSESSE